MSEEKRDFKRALLINIYTDSRNAQASEDSLEELERLADTYGLETIEKIPVMVRKMVSATLMGSGKVEELVGLASEFEVDVIIFDDEISPHQQRNLEKLFKKPV